MSKTPLYPADTPITHTRQAHTAYLVHCEGIRGCIELAHLVPPPPLGPQMGHTSLEWQGGPILPLTGPRLLRTGVPRENALP